MTPTRNEDREIWNSHEWQERRQRAREFSRWYDGVPLDEKMPERDRSTGELVKKFPLGINLPKIACRVHRNIMRGIPDADDNLVVRTSIPDSDNAEAVVNSVWRHSYGGSLQQDAMLDMNIYGGCVFLLKWLPWERVLPYRFALRTISPGNILPTWSRFDKWRMTSCYVGFEISKREAKERYGVTPSGARDRALYMEYWSRDEWWIHVDGQTPTQSWDGRKWKLSGTNEFGFVPIYYIPHERATKMDGESQVDGQEGLTKDFNSRATNVSDLVRSARPGVLYGHDLGHNLTIRKVEKDGVVFLEVVDIGNTRNVQSAEPPSLESIPMSDIPDGLIEFPDKLLTWWMIQNDVSPAVFGMDDTQSGRITGPATAQRMLASVSHSATERLNFTTGKNVIDVDIIRAFQTKQSAFDELDIEAPSVDVDPLTLHVVQRWPPKIPLDKTRVFAELVEELREGGTSLERYLKERGVDDVEEEKQRIMEFIEWKAKMEARASGGGIVEGQSADRGEEQGPADRQ